MRPVSSFVCIEATADAIGSLIVLGSTADVIAAEASAPSSGALPATALTTALAGQLPVAADDVDDVPLVPPPRFSAEQQQRVAAARSAGDLGLKERKSWYVQMNREFEREYKLATPTIPRAVLVRWQESKTKKGDVFCLFKEWHADPTCATIRVTEEHIKESTRIESLGWHWQSRWQINDTYHASLTEENKEMADSVMAKARDSKQHADHPDNPNWMLFLVLKEHLYIDLNKEQHRMGVQASGSVTDTAAAAELLNGATSSAIRDLSIGAPTGRGGGRGRGRGNTKVTKTSTVDKKVNLASEANALGGRILKFEINVNELTALKSTSYDEAVLTDARSVKEKADALLAKYKAMQINVHAPESDKVALQAEKIALMQGPFKDTEKNVMQRITAKKPLQVAAAPAIA